MAKLTVSERNAIIKAAQAAGRIGGRGISDVLKDAARKGKALKKHGEQRVNRTDVKVKVGKKNKYI